MVALIPHYLLMTETETLETAAETLGSWRFLLRQIDGKDVLDVADSEPALFGERLQLLAVIRGLEALGQPSHVTLVTTSRYVTRGIRRDLPIWRDMNWTWERFGELHPIAHADMWRRLDRALRFHEVQCRAWRFGDVAAEGSVARPIYRRLGSSLAGSRIPAFGAGRFRKQVVDGWMRMAQRLARRQTAESWMATG